MATLAITISILLIITTVLPFIKKEYWWIRIFDFPRAQICFFSFLALLFDVYIFYPLELKHLIWPIGLGGAFIYQLVKILPFTFFYKPVSKKAKEYHHLPLISLMVSNIKMSNRKTVKFISLVRKTAPDILLVNEPNAWWEGKLKEIESQFSYRIYKPLGNTYGMILYSKFKLINPQIRFLVDDEIPSFYTQVELPSNDVIDLYCVHPKPPSVGLDTDERDAELILVAKEAKERNNPAIVAGDLNDVAWSDTTRLFTKVSGLLDPRVGRGFFNTYNAFIPIFRYPLDHVFYEVSFQLVELRRLGKFGSDHFPIFIKLCYNPNAKSKQDKPTPTQEEKVEAERKLDNVGS